MQTLLFTFPTQEKLNPTFGELQRCFIIVLISLQALNPNNIHSELDNATSNYLSGNVEVIEDEKVGQRILCFSHRFNLFPDLTIIL